ncbi:MAG: DUF1830 domain-containing protein [Spirulinaceae cyanobacterium RM2_2_10]|nr:DUF1830 domain-containing protein [Spirulinaceae cyanobacterium SM2_1_0]NJO19905.1 DUF1830 domain-containing protein [Spirulinaceae cyanobacterium RM2_2_10]
MAQIFDPVPSSASNPVLCCYVNATSQIQVARITNIDNWYFERVVFPGQRLVFEALPDALLEIHSGMMASAILSDTIPCERLRIDGDSGSSEIGIAPPTARGSDHSLSLDGDITALVAAAC